MQDNSKPCPCNHPACAKCRDQRAANKPLTASQYDMLRRLADAPEMTPGGTPDSGRHASAWHRTLDVLVRRGLATRTSHGRAAHASITPEGRAMLARETMNGPDRFKGRAPAPYG